MQAVTAQPGYAEGQSPPPSQMPPPDQGAADGRFSAPMQYEHPDQFNVPPPAAAPYAVPAQTSVPLDRDAQECASYLEKMNTIIQEYDQTVSSTLIGPQGINLDEGAQRAAALRTLKLARQLKKIHPPKEIAEEHKQLAASLPTLHDFFQLSSPGSDSFNKGLALADQVRKTLDIYHQGVVNMIGRHALNPALDPVAAEQQAVTNRAMQGIQDWTNQAAGAINDGLQRLMQQPGAAPPQQNPSSGAGAQYRQPSGQSPGPQP